MYIHDVIGSLRERNLELQAQIDALRLDYHLLDKALARHEALLHNLSHVSRETYRPEGDGNGSSSALFEIDPPAAEASVGARRKRRGATDN